MRADAWSWSAHAVLPSDRDFAIARLDANGRLDTTFGDGGARLVDVAGAGLYDTASSVALQRSGRIIVGGHAEIPNGSKPGMILAAAAAAAVPRRHLRLCRTGQAR